MQVGHVTTPFGRRTMTYAMLARQSEAAKLAEDATADKWKLFRALCEARPKFCISDRALAVLSALLSFYPGEELRADKSLVVFPSNAKLSLRAHGMAEQTIRRHIAALVEAGLLIRKDSANGKRYARRNGQGAIGQAFGFSLAPLLARADEIQRMAAEVAAEKRQIKFLREQITICRRDILKLLYIAAESADFDGIAPIREEYERASIGLPRRPDCRQLHENLAALEAIREDILKYLEKERNFENTSGSDPQNERHKQDSEITTNLESETTVTLDNSIAETGKSTGPNQQSQNSTPTLNEIVSLEKWRETKKRMRHTEHTYPLSVVLPACPQIADYGPAGSISNWQDLVRAAHVVSRMLDISDTAMTQANTVLGIENTATVVACILERAEKISSAGGYLRDLTRKAERGEFTLGPMLKSLLRANNPSTGVLN